MPEVIVVIGPGQIGQAIARRVGGGKHVLLADMRPENAKAVAEVMANAGYEVSVATVDASSREAVRSLLEKTTAIGDVSGLIHAAGVSPVAGVARNHPQGRPVRHGACSGGVRQRF